MPNARNKKGYSAQDLREVRDNPEWTAEDFAKAKPFAEVFPEAECVVAVRRRIVRGGYHFLRVHSSDEAGR